jgi:hypothetical protein
MFLVCGVSCVLLLPSLMHLLYTYFSVLILVLHIDSHNFDFKFLYYLSLPPLLTRRRIGPTSKIYKQSWNEHNLVMGPNGPRNEEDWRGPAAIY